MRLIAFLILSGVALAQTMVQPSQLTPGTVVGAMVCTPRTATDAGGCRIAQLDPSIELDTSYNPPMLKSVITGQGISKTNPETITGLWTFALGVMLPPSILPVCDSAHAGRLIHDVTDSTLKFCNGATWLLASVPPEAVHNHWSLRTSTAILTAPQSTFAILDPTIVPDSLRVHRNGILQTLGPDYTRGGLGAAAPVVFTAASMPQIGDTVTIEYMW
jgi:hypothetical protein